MGIGVLLTGTIPWSVFFTHFNSLIAFYFKIIHGMMLFCRIVCFRKWNLKIVLYWLVKYP